MAKKERLHFGKTSGDAVLKPFGEVKKSARALFSINVQKDIEKVKYLRASRELIKYSWERFKIPFFVRINSKPLPSCPFYYGALDDRCARHLGRTASNGSALDVMLSNADSVQGANRPAYAGAVLDDEENMPVIPSVCSVSDVSRSSVSRLDWEDSLCKMAKAKQAKRCQIKKTVEGTEKYMGMSTSKGTRAYNYRKRTRYAEIVRRYEEDAQNTFFITLNYNGFDTSKPLEKAWEVFFKSVRSITHKMQRKWGVKYFLSVESDGSFLPHAHLLASFPSSIVDRIYIILPKWLETEWTIGSKSCDRLSDYGCEHTLHGYLSKELQYSIEDAPKYEDDRESPQAQGFYKAMNTLYFTEILGRKQFMYSKSYRELLDGIAEKYVSHETNDKPSSVKDDTLHNEFVNQFDKDLELIETANATGTYTPETDEAFFRLLGIMMPERCRKDWFTSTDAEKLQMLQENNGSLVCSCQNRGVRHGSKAMTCSCSMLPYFDARKFTNN